MFWWMKSLDQTKKQDLWQTMFSFEFKRFLDLRVMGIGITHDTSSTQYMVDFCTKLFQKPLMGGEVTYT